MHKKGDGEAFLLLALVIVKKIFGGRKVEEKWEERVAAVTERYADTKRYFLTPSFHFFSHSFFFFRINCSSHFQPDVFQKTKVMQ